MSTCREPRAQFQSLNAGKDYLMLHTHNGIYVYRSLVSLTDCLCQTYCVQFKLESHPSEQSMVA